MRPRERAVTPARALLGLCAAVLAALAAPASAQNALRTGGRPEVGGAEERVLNNVRLDQKLNQQVPLDLVFRDESGKQVRLHEYFGRKPVMLMLIQYRCTMLCNEQMNVLLASLKRMSFTPGKEFNLLIATIDPREKPDLAAEKKENYLREYGRPQAADGWHFLTGDEASIRRLADSVGFHYTYDAKTDQYAHPDGVMLLTPLGKIARYFFRLEYPARDLRLGLVEAADNKIGTPLDALALLCYHYNPTTGTYGLALMKVLRLAAAGTVFVLALGVVVMRLRDRESRRRGRVLLGDG